MPQSVFLSTPLVILPAIGYSLMLAIARRRGACWRGAAINAAVGWGVAVILITEILSRPHWLSRRGLVIAWLALDLVLAAVVWLWAGRPAKGRDGTVISSVNEPLAETLQGLDKVFLAGVGLIALLTTIITLMAPPNHFDVLTYHLPRIVYWLQNQSAFFFPTDDGRQIHQPPGAEYAVLHLHALAGSDRFDGVIQLSGFLLSVVAVSLIAGRMGADRRAQILAAVFCATIPQGILQATGGKNDYVLAFLLSAMVYYLLVFRDEPSLVAMFGAGASLGLALITKGTAYFFAPPLMALAFTWPKSAWARALKLAPIGIAVVIALNLAHWTRNYRLCGSPLGPSAEGLHRELPFGNEIFTPSTIFSNLARNSALHLWTPSERINELTVKAISKAVRASGADVNDRRTTWHVETFGVRNRPFNESHAGNTLHFLLTLLAFAAITVKPELRRSQWALAFGIIGGFVLFCAALRWQPWHVRLHIPLFALSAVPVSLFLSRVRPKPIGAVVGCALLLMALPWALHNERRSLLPGAEFNILRRNRTELYFVNRRELLSSYSAAAAEIKKSSCPEIGIDSYLGSFEYPLLALLGAANGSIRVRHVNVSHPSRVYAEAGADARPCLIACLECPVNKAQNYASRGMRALNFQGLTVFIPNNGGSP